MDYRRTWKMPLLCAAIVLLSAGGTARASMAFDVAVGMNVNEDTPDLPEREQSGLASGLARLHPGVPLSRGRLPRGGFPGLSLAPLPQFILRLRSEGYPWYDIFYRLNVDPAVLFVGMDHRPGPSLRKGLGLLEEAPPAGHHPRIRFSDRDVVGLVKVQTASRHFGASPYA